MAELKQQPDQGEKETGASSVIQAGGDTAGAGQSHLLRECKGVGGYDLDRTNGVEVRDCGSTFDPLFICCLFPSRLGGNFSAIQLINFS